jgi:hypothetical protein
MCSEVNRNGSGLRARTNCCRLDSEVLAAALAPDRAEADRERALSAITRSEPQIGHDELRAISIHAKTSEVQSK